MKIHQAFFGDKNGSHNLIANSIENKVVIGHLKLNTDIPASITIQESYLSGFRVENYYVLTKTMNDSGSERPGMGFSHCIIIPVEFLSEIDNLKDVIRLFVDAPQKGRDVLPDLELALTPATTLATSSNFPDMILKLTGNPGTVVYLGYQDFESDLKMIWRTMSAKLRANLAFTISGSPNEIESEQYTFIHTPEAYEPRWSKFPVVKNKVVDQDALEPVKLLIEPTSADAIDFDRFIEVNAINFEHLHQYPAIAKLYRLSKQAIAAPETVLLKRVIVAISELIPKPENGKVLKRSILDLFINGISTTATGDILLLRNMVFTAFADGTSKISNLMASWTEQFISPENRLFFPDGVKVMKEAYLPENPEWWKEQIVNKFDRICQQLDQRSSGFIWKLWTTAPTLIQQSKIGPSGDSLLYTQSKPVSDPEFYRQLTPYSTGKQWYILHAESVSYELAPLRALQAQITLDKSSELEKHLNIIRANISDPAFFRECTNIDNVTLHRMAGKLLASHSTYFASLEVTNLNWQNIWYQAYLLSNDISIGGRSIHPEFMAIIDMVVNKSNYNKPLLNAIANQTGNLYGYAKRTAVWNLLANDTKAIVLDKTCSHVVIHFQDSEWPGFENEIKQNFLRPEFIKAEVISSKTIGIAAKVEILETINKVTADYIIEITNIANDNINHLEAETLTAVINKHTLKKALDYFYQYRGRHPLFNEVVNSCKHMLSGWERLWLKTSANPVSLHDLYREIDRQNLHYVFKILRDLGFNDHDINRIQKEYIAGVKGIELEDLCNRLKSYVHSKS